MVHAQVLGLEGCHEAHLSGEAGARHCVQSRCLQKNGLCTHHRAAFQGPQDFRSHRQVSTDFGTSYPGQNDILKHSSAPCLHRQTLRSHQLRVLERDEKVGQK